MTGLDPVIHVLPRHTSKTWMPGTSPGMTILKCWDIKHSCRTLPRAVVRARKEPRPEGGVEAQGGKAPEKRLIADYARSRIPVPAEIIANPHGH